ncbi:uncharacterized protein LOC129731216 [Wyeomyia smithii]|uniref:uncharacterized protein LOC129731216 n=1 Tax=Wyeomyia smithii TaxID=174621 RepID=UPI002467B56C|nr:uncharacterized protein LOC129731216 [Wyeomyia smithii]
MYNKYVVFFVSMNVVISICNPISRLKRQLFSPPEGCTVSHQEIEELITLTKNLNAAVEGSLIATRSGFDEVESNRDKCAKKLSQFRETVQGIIQIYKSVSRGTVDNVQFDREKARYQTDIQRLLQRIDNLKRDVEDSYRSEVESLRNNMQNFKVQVDDNLKLLEEEKSKSKSAWVQLCIANIRAGRIDDATKGFTNIDKPSYQKIITEVYENRPENADSVMNFLEAVDLYHEPITGYEILYDYMKRNNQLNGSRGRRLLTHIMALIAADDENSTRAINLLSTFKSDV